MHCMANVAMLAKLLRIPLPNLKGGSCFNTMKETVEAVGQCKKREVGREEGERKGRKKIGRNNCQQGKKERSELGSAHLIWSRGPKDNQTKCCWTYVSPKWCPHLVLTFISYQIWDI